jgi:Fe-S-cluster-containing hydrogenase component 2
MSKVLTYDYSKCTACRACELACSMRHQEEFNPARSRIHTIIFPEEAVYIPLACTQCEDAWCAKSCPAGAITHNDDLGVWWVDIQKCVGCRMCEMACPFGDIAVNPRTGKAEKCDLCGGEPECTLFCVPKAIQYREPEGASLNKKKAVSAKLKGSHKEVRL